MSFFIAHITYAERLLSASLKGKERKDIIVGTTFPDIRYLGVIERDKTHFKNLTFKDIQGEENSFVAGVKLHDLIDVAREKYMEENVYPLISDVRNKIRSLKIAEDIILDDKIKNREELVKMFKNVLPDEKNFSIPDSKLTEWHKIVTNYLREKVSPESIVKVGRALSFSDAEIQEYAKDGYSISNNLAAKNLVLNFYDNLEKELTNYLA